MHACATNAIFLPRFYNVNGTLTVSLCKRKLSIVGSGPILVLRTVLGWHARADAKNDVENDQGPAILRATGVSWGGSDLGNLEPPRLRDLHNLLARHLRCNIVTPECNFGSGWSSTSMCILTWYRGLFSDLRVYILVLVLRILDLAPNLVYPGMCTRVDLDLALLIWYDTKLNLILVRLGTYVHTYTDHRTKFRTYTHWLWSFAYRNIIFCRDNYTDPYNYLIAVSTPY